MKNFKKIFNGFTLVELIIVITILAILATIAFVSFQNYTKDARDSNRLTTISNISKGLDLFSIKTGSFPLPNNISGTGMIGIHALVQVGNIDSSISSLINMHTTPVDPASASKYIYGLSSNGKNYQVASVFENLQSNNILFDTTYASAYKAKVIGNFNGIMRFHSGTTCVANIPSLIFNASGSVDLLGNNIGYVIDKYENLPYNIGKENYQLVKTTSEILSSISNTGAVTYECGIDAISWETKKAALQTSLGYNVDKIGQSVFGDKYYTEVNNTTSGGGGGAGSPSIPNISFVDFETENNYTVTQSPWNRTNGEKNEGSYSIESGNTALNSSACFEVSTIKSLPFRVMFDFKLSTDSSDNLVYYSNGEVMDYYSGEYPWQTYDSDLSLGTYYTPGSYTFKWCYEKDVSVSAGLDKVWVDNIHIEDATGAVNAVCGDSLGKYYYTQAPTTNLCSMGTPLGMSDGGVLSDYSWDCQGYNGGNLATCSAQHAFGWDYTPPTIKDFFGKRSIYTQNWDRKRYDTTTCNAALMTIQNLSPGTNVIPAVLADNTIYVLAPGKYITSSEIMMGNCSGIIGNGDVNIYSSVYLSDMIKSFDGMGGNIQNSILANIKVHGTSNGASGTHSTNSCGATTSTNATIYNSEFEGFYNGICDYNPNPTFNKIKVYNNSRGIDKVSDLAVYTNIMMYNNSNYGLWSDGGSFNTYNNMLAFNNGDGLRIAYEYGSTLNNVVTFNNQYSGYYGTIMLGLVNNLYAYNNGKTGLSFDTSVGSIYSLNMNNISTFNNTLTGMIMKGDAPDDIVFYGYTKSFANNPNSVFVNTKLGTGSTLGWSNGTALDTSGTFSQNMIITPNNLGWNFNTKGKQAVTFSGGTTVTYGINLPNQQPPFTTDPNSEANYLFGENTIHYNTSKKIGEW